MNAKSCYLKCTSVVKAMLVLGILPNVYSVKAVLWCFTAAQLYRTRNMLSQHIHKYVPDINFVNIMSKSTALSHIFFKKKFITIIFFNCLSAEDCSSL